jgi:hypothetical protein
MTENFTLVPHFSHRFAGAIWNMVFEPDKETLFLEIRAENPHRTSFSALDLRSGRLLWSAVEVDEPRWVSLSLCGQGLVLLHAYHGPQNPQHKHLYALDAATGQLKWKLPDHRLAIWKQGKVGVQNKEEEILWIHPQTASVLEDATVGEMEGEFIPAKENSAIQYPFHYQEGTPYFDKVREFIGKKTGWQVVQAVDYFQTEEVIAISCYIYQPEGLANYLLLYDRQGNERERHVLAEGLKAPGTETFFLWREYCLFVTNRNQLNCIAIQKI